MNLKKLKYFATRTKHQNTETRAHLYAAIAILERADTLAGKWVDESETARVFAKELREVLYGKSE